jgi:hypothetical protein
LTYSFLYFLWPYFVHLHSTSSSSSQPFLFSPCRQHDTRGADKCLAL